MKIESKAIIFVRYLGKNIFYENESHVLLGIELDGTLRLKEESDLECIGYLGNNDYLQLKPLSSISDEDCNWIANCDIVDFRDGLIGSWNGKDVSVLYDAVRNDIEYFSKYSEVSQYLQLEGYATPQTVIEDGKVVTYSVEELVKLGIYKLI